MKELEIKEIPINKIHSNVNQPRETFNKEKIEEMTKSIEKYGLLNPITVRCFNDGYQIVAGERRWKALQMMGRKEIQAKIVEADDIETDIMSIAENYHREDLTLEEREKSIYAAWKHGNEEKNNLFKNTVSIMSEYTGIQIPTLTRLINAGKEKENTKSETISKSTAVSLQTTRSLKEISPKLREDLLQSELNEQTPKEDETIVEPKEKVDQIQKEEIVEKPEEIVEKIKEEQSSVEISKEEILETSKDEIPKKIIRRKIIIRRKHSDDEQST